MVKTIGAWLLVMLLLAAVFSFRDRSLVAGQAPAFNATVFNDKTGPRDGPSLIYFWASWCGICKAIQGTMQTVLQQYPGVTVALKSGDEQAVRRYLRSAQLDWPFVLDQQGAIAERFGVAGVPTIFILDGNGKIRFTAVGYSSIWGLRFRLWLAGFD